MYCITHTDKPLKFILTYVHGPTNKSTTNVTIACSIDCLREQLNPENKKESMLEVIDSYIDVLG